jgi:hypothetical protein
MEMISFGDKKWKEFSLDKLFIIEATSSGIDKIKLKPIFGSIPYITRTDKDNGLDGFVGVQTKSKSDNGNIISIGLDTQTAFYQPTKFYTGQNIQILSGANINKYTALFIIPLLKRLMTKFNWGGNGATLTRLRRSKLLLPVNAKDNPDWDFMEEYMRESEKKLIRRYRNYITILESSKIPIARNLTPIWQEFVIDDIFAISPGKRLTQSDMRRGKKPFVGASDSNNGITAFVSNSNTSQDENVLGVNYNGSVVENFYHPYTAIFSDDVKRFKLKNRAGNKYLYLFLKQEILQQKEKYQYGYKFNETRMKRQTLLLPSTKSGQPDYNYMESVMCEIEIKQLRRYLAYLDARL